MACAIRFFEQYTPDCHVASLLAQAERWARDNDREVSWEEDQESSWEEGEERYVCFLRVKGQVACLGGIDLGPDRPIGIGIAHYRPLDYARLIEAELALELMEDGGEEEDEEEEEEDKGGEDSADNEDNADSTTEEGD